MNIALSLELPPTNCFAKNTKHTFDEITLDSYQDKKIKEIVEVGSTSVSKEFIRPGLRGFPETCTLLIWNGLKSNDVHIRS